MLFFFLILIFIVFMMFFFFFFLISFPLIFVCFFKKFFFFCTMFYFLKFFRCFDFLIFFGSFPQPDPPPPDRLALDRPSPLDRLALDPSARPPKMSRLFPSPAPSFALFLSLEGLLVEFCVFGAPGPWNAHVWVLGLSRETSAENFLKKTARVGIR